MKLASEFTDFGQFATQGTTLKALDLSDAAKPRYWKQFQRTRQGFYGVITRRFGRALNDLGNRVERAAIGAATKTQIPEAVRSEVNASDSIYREAIVDTYVRVVPLFYAKVLRSLTEEASLKQDGEDEISPTTQARAVDAARSFVESNPIKLVDERMAWTREVMVDAARDAVDEGLKKGWGIEKIARKMRENSGAALSATRARRIARTETITASNFGSIEAARSTQIDLLKEWIATDDDRTRQTHRQVDFETVPLSGTFNVGGFPAEFPADPSLPGGERINCRCTLAYIKA